MCYSSHSPKIQQILPWRTALAQFMTQCLSHTWQLPSPGDSAHTAASSTYFSSNDIGRVLLIWGQITALTKVRFKDCSAEFLFIMWLLNNNPEKHWCNLDVYQQARCLLPSQVMCVPQSLKDYTMEKGKESNNWFSILIFKYFSSECLKCFSSISFSFLSTNSLRETKRVYFCILSLILFVREQ